MNDIEVGRYALRTFSVNHRTRELVSVGIRGSHWKDGTCEAKCLAREYFDFLPDDRPVHEAPHEGCTCGVYGALSLEALAEQFFFPTNNLVAVFAAEGTTIIGDTGLKTAYARVVAYWSPQRGIRKICGKQFVGARKFDDVDVMLGAYRLPRGDVTLFPPKRRSTVSPVLWVLFCLFFTFWNLSAGWSAVATHDWWWGCFNLFMTLVMLCLAVLHYRRLRTRIG